ncbi:unnamed product [Ostreococcus tauri]|uniref:Unnamed product n=1 Tax=Ostreococcus tauri TaxID=70448 RepID=Q01D24_OSTTA|nr:unnamed product [Ostreococcus tauri]CAL52779.1 unnamed product [Ostreococcus tauri]|eukprot:XP_003078039.1 unnamed product [Ostreococcus tauri]
MAASKLGSKDASTRPTVGSTLDASALTPPASRFTIDKIPTVHPPRSMRQIDPRRDACCDEKMRWLRRSSAPKMHPHAQPSAQRSTRAR